MSRGLCVALIGTDGAGKSTVARRVVAVLGESARYLYTGVNLEASTVVLPTTWLYLRLKRLRGHPPDMAGPPDPARSHATKTGVRTSVRRGLRTANRIAEEWLQQTLAALHRRRGRIVVLDRLMYADYFFHDVVANGPRPVSSRVHGWLLRRYRMPELTVCLDIPAEVALARKQEGTLESLARRRDEYLRFAQETPGVVIVDASKPLDDVIESVTSLVKVATGR